MEKFRKNEPIRDPKTRESLKAEYRDQRRKTDRNYVDSIIDMADLFETDLTSSRQVIGEQAVVLRGFAVSAAEELIAQIHQVEKTSPFRHMTTPRGFTMSVATTNCGHYGWISDRRGYRYTTTDPLTSKSWPSMPPIFTALAKSAAIAADFHNFEPDACLINRYVAATKLSLHQDKDEEDFDSPIVSVSLGITATFQFGGFDRTSKKINVPLHHGDVVVWGGVDRLRYHGIPPIKISTHPLLGESRINLTFRKSSAT